MTRFTGYIIHVALAVISVSCVEPMDLDPHEGRSLVVNCILTESDVQTLELYYTYDLSGKESEPIADATVRLTCDYEPVAEFTRGDDGLWRANHRPEYNKHYRLDVTVGDQHFGAYTIFPEDIHVDTYVRGYWKDENLGIYYSVYSYELRVYDVFIAPYYGRECLTPNHLWIFPRDLGWGDDYQRYIATSHLCADDFNIEPISVRDLPCFSSDSIALMPQWLKRQLAWCPEMLGNLQMHDKFVRIDIPRDYHNGQTLEGLKYTPLYSDKAFALVRDFPLGFLDSNSPCDGNIYDIYILSNEADKYFKDVYRRHLNKDNFVFEYDTENIYTNIQGGLGVFGAMVHRNDMHGVRGYLDDYWDP